MSPGESCDSRWGHRDHLFLSHFDKRSNVGEGALGKDRGCFDGYPFLSVLRRLILFRCGGLDLRFLAGPPFSIKVIASNKKLGDVDSPTVGTGRSSSKMRKLTLGPTADSDVTFSQETHPEHIP